MICSRAAASAPISRRTFSDCAVSSVSFDLLRLQIKRVLHLLAGKLLGEQALHAVPIVGRQVDLADLDVAQNDAVGRQPRLQLGLDRLLDFGPLGREDLAHRVTREHLVDHALRGRLDDLGADVVRQALGERGNLERIDRVAHRQVGAEREAFDRLQRRGPVGAAHLRRTPALVAQRKDAHLLQAGKDEDAALVPFAPRAREVIDATADLATADALHGRMGHHGHRRRHGDRDDHDWHRRAAQIEATVIGDDDCLVAALVVVRVVARRALAAPRQARANRIEPDLETLLPHDLSPHRGTIAAVRALSRSCAERR